MKIIRTKYFPFIQGYKAVNLFGVLFIRPNARMTEQDINHEAIHSEQIKELLYIFFYICYAFEFLYRVIFTKSRFSNQAYLDMSFEKEAYYYDDNLDYIKTRKHYAMWRQNNYIK